MAQNHLFDALNPEEYRVVGSAAYGVMDGYPFSMTQTGANRLTVRLTMQSPLEKGGVKVLRAELRQHGIRANVNGRAVIYQVKTNRNTIPGDILSGICAAVSALRQFGAFPPAVCALCHQGSPDAYMSCGGNYDAVHAACAEQLHNSARTKASENPGSYARGVVGGLIGAVVGALPAFIAIQFLHFISAWLFMLIPIATYYGYKKLGGRMDRVASVVSVLLSLVGLGVVVLCWDVAQNMEWLGRNLGEAIAYTFQNMFLPGYWSWLGSNGVSILVFYVIGLVFSASVIRRTNKTDLKNADQMRATLLLRRTGGQSAAADAPRTEPVSPSYAPSADPWDAGGDDLSEKDWSKLK